MGNEKKNEKEIHAASSWQVGGRLQKSLWTEFRAIRGLFKCARLSYFLIVLLPLQHIYRLESSNSLSVASSLVSFPLSHQISPSSTFCSLSSLLPPHTFHKHVTSSKSAERVWESLRRVKERERVNKVQLEFSRSTFHLLKSRVEFSNGKSYRASVPKASDYSVHLSARRCQLVRKLELVQINFSRSPRKTFWISERKKKKKE